MQNATLCYLIKKEKNKIIEILLAMKKRGFGKNRLNGCGGKVEKNEKIEQTLKRETEEEIAVKIERFYKVAELKFLFPDNPKWNQIVRVYFVTKWHGQPKESNEMKPKWFSVSKIPYDKMWPDDIYWLPKTIEGKFIKAEFTFGENDKILENNVKIIE